MAKPRHKVHVQTGAKTISQSSKAATNLQPPFTLFYVSLPDALLPMKINNEKIFIVGSSPLAFSTTEELCTQRLQETPIIYFYLSIPNFHLPYPTGMRVSKFVKSYHNKAYSCEFLFYTYGYKSKMKNVSIKTIMIAVSKSFPNLYLLSEDEVTCFSPNVANIAPPVWGCVNIARRKRLSLHSVANSLVSK